MNNRLKQFASYKGLSITELERQIKVSNGTLSKPARSGGSIGGDKLQKILFRFPDLSAEWLMRGEGDMLKTEPVKTDDKILIEMLKGEVERLTKEKDNYWRLVEHLTGSSK